MAADAPGVLTNSTDMVSDEKPSSASSPVQAPPRPGGIAWILVIIAILASTFLFALDNTVTANIQPTIEETFHDVSRLTWISVAYLLGAASMNLFWGQLYTRLDAKWTYIGCLTLFEAGSALCGGAPNMTAFIFGRAMCGLFGAGMYVGSMALIALTTYEHERATYFGLVGITWGFGTVLGPIIGGALADAHAWRWAFYLNLFVGALAAPVLLFQIPSKDPQPGMGVKARLAPIDFVGAVLLAGSMVTLIMAISFGGVVYAWSSGSIIALFVVSGVLVIAFALQQTFTILTTKEMRIFPLHFLRSPLLVILAFIVAAAATASFVLIFFVPLFYQLVAGESALQSGVHLLPYVAFMVAVCVGSGMALSKWGYYMPWCVFSGVFIVIGSATLFIVDEHTSTPKVYGFTIIYALGVGATIQLPFSVASAKVPPEEGGLAVGYCSFFQFIGPAVALSIGNAAFLNEAANKLSSLLPGFSREVILGSLFGLYPEVLSGNSNVSHETIVSVIADAIGNVYAIPLSAGALILVLSVFMSRERLFVETVISGG
ncbi:MFS drug efflux transporter [Xylariaceae sp. FL0016]|nr:MFS drug efflux transporter [Xylariaceae sp. FL0016]